jgi:trigger factor
MLQGAIIERMLDLHSVPVPQSVVETYLDSFVEQVKQRNDGELPDDFDMELFRKNQEGEAERQGRWMLIRDALIEQEGIEVDEEDLMTFFEEQGDDEISAQQLQQFYRSMPKLMERVKQQLLSQKVFDTLMEQFDIEDKTREEYEEEMEAAHHHAHDHAHPPAGAPEEAPAGESTIITE